MIGKTKVIFDSSFEPDPKTHFQLDTRYLLATRCISGDIRFKVEKSFSTRNTVSEIPWLNSYNSTFHFMSEIGSGLVAVHFGRGSNPLARKTLESVLHHLCIY